MIVLSRYGRREWLGLTLILAPIALAAAWAALSSHPAWWIASSVALLLWFAGVMFFRDPLGRRPSTDDHRDLVSPADGRVSAVLELPHHDAVGGEALLVRIFLSVLDVHLNRAPCDGIVDRIDHRPGKYLDARSEESARVNESLLMVLRCDRFGPIGVRQVSGAIARRIVCAVRPGDRLARSQRYGMIKFGSTTELIVAKRGPGGTATARVSKGDRVVGGVTILAHIGTA